MGKIFFKRKAHEGMIEKPRGSGIVLDVIVYMFLLSSIIIFMVPLWHVVMASFSEGNRLIAHTGIAWFPIVGDGAAWNLGAYKLLFEYNGILTGYANTILYVVAGTLLGLVLNVIGGYVMCRKSMFQRFFIVYVIITMLFNGGMLPTFTVVLGLGLVETRLSIILLTCTNALYMILTMNAFRGVNASTVEAAEIDGAGHFNMMFKVMLPQCLSMISVVLLFTVVGIWNSWFEAKIYIPYNREAWPLQLWINEIRETNANFAQEQNPDWNKYVLTFSVIVISTLPILAVATIFQKYIEKGVLIGGVKE